MFQTRTYLNKMSKASKIYILVAVTLPLAVSSVVLHLSEGNLLSALLFSIAPTFWSMFALYMAWRYSKNKQIEKPQLVNDKIPRNMWLNRLLKTSCLLILFIAMIFLITAITLGSHLSSTLSALWFIIVNGSEFIFVNILTDESVNNR